MINVKTDSRKVKPGDIFVALRGISSDGHDYIDKAISLGASKLIVMDDKDYKIDYEVVEDTRKWLNDYLVENYSNYFDEMTLIGLTGTNGKTTTAYLIYECLNKLGTKCAYIGTIGYYLDKLQYRLANTSPDICDLYELIINAYDNGYKTVVLEASSQGLHKGRLNGLKFDYAIFTNLTQDHLDYHITMDNYAKAKKMLFDMLKPNGISILNNDDEAKKYFITNNTVYYGTSNCDYKANNIIYNHQGTKLEINGNKFETKLLGDYNMYNTLSTYVVLNKLGFSNEEIKTAFETMICPDGRMDIVKYKNNSIIIDYAHTPDAIEKIIKTVEKLTNGNIYTVFGCTGDRDRTKRPIMTNIVLSNSKKAIITIDDLHNEDINNILNDMLENNKLDNYEIELNRCEAIKKGIKLLKNNDILLILGKGHEDFIICKNEKIAHNDKKAVLKIIEEEN